MKKIFVMIGGVLLMAVGVFGLIMPILPGWPLIFLGLSIFAPAYAFRMKYKIDLKLFKRDIVYFSEWRKKKVDTGVTTKFFPVLLKKTGELDAAENRAKLTIALAQSPAVKKKHITFGGGFAYLNQVHGDGVAVIEDKGPQEPAFRRFEATDAAITNVPGLTLLAMSADCLTLFFYAPGWVGIAHAGWRGTQKGVAKKTLALLMEKSGAPASQVRVIFGPSICRKHYEVGKEFKEYFSSSYLKKESGRYHLDLVKANKKQLLGTGMPRNNISVSGLCTIGHSKHFYSHRTEKEAAGRMISFIQLRAKI